MNKSYISSPSPHSTHTHTLVKNITPPPDKPKIFTHDNLWYNITTIAEYLSLRVISAKTSSSLYYSDGLSDTSVKFRWLRLKLPYLTITNLKSSMWTLSLGENEPGLGDSIPYALTSRLSGRPKHKILFMIQLGSHTYRWDIQSSQNINDCSYHLNQSHFC